MSLVVMDNLRIAVVGFVLLSILILARGFILSRVVDILSWVLDKWLSRRHTIRHTETLAAIPSTRYRFPNGQGDAEKFLRGRENSLLWGQRLGGIYRIWSGMTPEIVLTTPEQIREVFRDSDKHIKAVNNNSGYLVGEIIGKCVGLVSQDEWKTLRRVTENAFVRSQAVRYTGIVQRHTARHLDELRETSALGAHGVLDPAADLKMLPFWIVAEIIYGTLQPDEVGILAALAAAREALWHKVMQGGLTRFRWSQYLPTATNRELASFKLRWARFNHDMVARLDAEGAETPIVDMFLAVKAGTVSAEAVLQTLDESLFANLDVTLGGISWNLVYLAAYPSVQECLRTEIAEERRRAAEVRVSSPVGNDDAHDTTLDEYTLRSTTYLAACILESSRLRPLAAFSVPQAAPTARVVDGYLVPAGTNFIVDSYAVNQRHAASWGKDGGKYRPQRFLDGAGNGAAGRLRYGFWRFGFGPRQCMGKYVADLVIRSLLVHLVENYTLGVMAGDDEETWARDPESWINHPHLQLRCEARRMVRP